MAFNLNEPRDEFGRWTSFGGALSGGDGRRRPRPIRPQDRRVRWETRPFRGFGIKGEVRYLGEHGFWEIRRGGGRGWRTQNPYGLPTLKDFGGRHAIGADGDLAIFPDLDAAENGWIDFLAYHGNRLTVGQFLKNHFAKLGIDGEHPWAELSDKLKDKLEKSILGMGGEARTHLVKFLEDLHPMAKGFIEHGPVTHDTPLPDLHMKDTEKRGPAHKLPATRAGSPTEQAAGSHSLHELRVSSMGQNFIKSWESGPEGNRGRDGFASRQYPSPEGGTDTIGWGHKLIPGEKYPNGIDERKAEDLFQRDLEKHQAIVKNNVRITLTQNQYDALVSLS